MEWVMGGQGLFTLMGLVQAYSPLLCSLAWTSPSLGSWKDNPCTIDPWAVESLAGGHVVSLWVWDHCVTVASPKFLGFSNSEDTSLLTNTL